jgi:hypothetical protein
MRKFVNTRRNKDWRLLERSVRSGNRKNVKGGNNKKNKK